MSRPNVPRWRTVLMISTAQALCDAGELERGVELATQGLLMAHSCQSPRQMNRVRKPGGLPVDGARNWSSGWMRAKKLTRQRYNRCASWYVRSM